MTFFDQLNKFCKDNDYTLYVIAHYHDDYVVVHVIDNRDVDVKRQTESIEDSAAQVLNVLRVPKNTPKPEQEEEDFDDFL